MRHAVNSVVAGMMVSLLLAAMPAGAQGTEGVMADTAFLSTTELERQMRETVNRRIPASLRINARCVAVFPSVVKAGLILAAKHGNGLVTCRRAADRAWGAPAYFSITAASIGIQAGIQSASYVLLFLHDEAVESLLREEVRFGNDISLAAGPVGAAANVAAQPDVVSYVRTAGLFAGVDLEGAVIGFARAANAALYGEGVTARDVLLGSRTVPAPLAPFHAQLERFAPLP